MLSKSLILHTTQYSSILPYLNVHSIKREKKLSRRSKSFYL